MMIKIKKIIRLVRKKITKFRRWPKVTIFVALFAIVGIIFLVITRAATPTTSFEAENNTRSPASNVFDASASGGSAIQFKLSNETWAAHMGIGTGTSRTNMDKAKALGVKWVGISWEMGWGTFDNSIVTYAHSIGLKVKQSCQKTVPSNLDSINGVSKRVHGYGTFDIANFASYCASYVDKGVDAIEIGNEWNHEPFWYRMLNASDTYDKWQKPDGDYTLQAQLVDATMASIRAKSATLPIVTPGWSSDSSPRLPWEAMGQLIEKSNGNIKKYGSYVAHHPYAYRCNALMAPDNTTADIVNDVNKVSPLQCEYPRRRDWNNFLLIQDVYNNAKIRGYDKPIWLSEIGGPSGNGTNDWTKQPFTLASQAALTREYIDGIRRLRGLGYPIDQINWMTIQDGQSATIYAEETFGLYDKDWNIKPAGQVVKDQASKPW